MSDELPFDGPDRNKNALTHTVTSAAAAYLDSLGYKPVETEVPVRDGWVADLAGVIVPTRTEAINMKLAPRKPSCDYRRYRDAEYMAAYGERVRASDAAYEALPEVITAVVEVKTSRADFFRDKKWKADPPADLRYLAVPSGMLKREEYPEGWSVLSAGEEGGMRMVHRGELTPVTLEQRMRIVLAVAVRRDHQTRYARLREFQKARRAEDAEHTTVRRFTYCLFAVQAILKGEGESVERVLERYSIKGLSKTALDELHSMWGARKVEVSDGR